ncbi:DUF1345 domain-containing protein [Methylobacterium sp. WL30]|jgi:uncharacterized membrane protein|uniref:DUF1345 domain-containing protein n=1 Tax=unclassified Methylobacterium TaxID=2615210 RepID=UPI0011CB4471|nr:MULTISPECIES: DUF1345 domain-containing protein [unclassified Methylobacterium]MCJ2042281.1 DUF1345 domain-containing protein [Methylobacterium sp. J-059]MCJ2075942.1 DUF1345 domain-containing protein [Methylobacterium sp. E-016]TXM87764.1 DUF1345 domain-containing protein [Methylobacterium sp. WL116]TXN21652.1 DUF1345 domain-containing protein [Methylobacterium sp. WL93]TXN47206.1 DUF1345 domain-containing protein [Methylobacterium sp. WL119]
MINPIRAFRLRPRLLAAFGIMAAGALLMPGDDLVTRLLAGWCAGIVAYAVLIVHQSTGQSRDALRLQASRLDDSAALVTVFTLLAAAASFAAVGVLVLGGKASGAGKVFDLTLAGATVLCTWAFVQLVFTIHYAHVYYGDDAPGESRGGLDFHGDDAPDFWDFLYFTVTIGAAAATSDTNITSKRMRRIATVQTVYAYLFNTGVLALAVNMAAGFVGH